MLRMTLAVVVAFGPLTCWAQTVRDQRPLRPAPLERSSSMDKAPPEPVAKEVRKEIDLNAQIIEWEITIAEWRLTPTDESEVNTTINELEGPAAEVKQHVTALAKAGKLQVLQRLRLLSLEGQEASLRLGGRRPQISSINMTNFGQQNQMVYQDVGAMLSILSRAKDDVVFAQISLEKGDLASPPDAPVISENKAGEKVRASILTTLSVHTALRAANGQTVVVSGFGDKTERYLLLATPKIQK